MGIFGGYFNSTGPGVPKDGPKKKGIALYFELFIRHFWDFCKENMMYFVASLPLTIILYLVFSFYDVLSISGIDIHTAESIKAIAITLYVVLCGSGPASAAMAYMMRCITREEHCFLWTDFKEKFKENFKITMILSIIDFILLIGILPIAARFYFYQYMETGSMLWFALLIFILFALVVYTIAHMYFYQFAITFENSFKETLINSILMALSNLPITIGLVLIPIIMTLLFIIPNVSLVWVFVAIFWLAFMRYPLEFYASRVISKKLLNKN